ncbi:hypothetical protein OIU84_005894 [Salix udensis]|uniref:Uncharacterized protein n=1 Tax=Salix udensis TaxID=889485 RepID=A0AAD6P1I0_9ROSI|nr:hypothetical protein OIU84_005894 [Salix udensis]
MQSLLHPRSWFFLIQGAASQYLSSQIRLLVHLVRTRSLPVESIERAVSPLHSLSTSESSLSGIVGNGQGLDIARISLMSSEERSTSLMSSEERSINSEERNLDSVRHCSASPSRREVSTSVRADGLLSQNHNRSASASGAVGHAAFPQGASGAANESSEFSNHLTSYSSDTSGEVKPEPQTSVLHTAHREPEFLSRLVDTRSRSQTIWRRPSDRLVPRIVSSSAIETRADLAGIETEVQKLVEDLKSTLVDTQRDATAKLRLLAKHNMDNRIVIANFGAISLLLCTNSSRFCHMVLQEGAVPPLVALSQSGTPRAKEKAQTLLSYFRNQRHGNAGRA